MAVLLAVKPTCMLAQLRGAVAEKEELAVADRKAFEHDVFEPPKHSVAEIIEGEAGEPVVCESNSQEPVSKLMVPVATLARV